MKRAIAIFLAVAATVASVSAPASAGKPPARPRLKVAITRYLSYAPLFIAEAQGYFADEGLDVELVQMSRTAGAVASLVQGEIDVLPGHIGPAYLNAIARGADIRIVADKGHDGTVCEHHAILARRELVESGRLTDPASLRGLRVSGERGQPSHYYISRILARGGLTADDVTLVDLPPAARLEAFRKGQLDVAHESEPWLTILKRDAGVVEWSVAEITDPDFQAAVVMFGPRLLRREPELGERFLVAYLRAVRQLALGKTKENVAALAAGTHLDEKTLAAVCWPEIHEDGSILPESILEYETWALADGLIDRIVGSEEFWDGRFAAAAVKTLDERAGAGR